MIYEFRKLLFREEDQEYVDILIDRMRSEALLKVKEVIKDGKRYVIKLNRESVECPHYMTPNISYTLEIEEVQEEKVDLEEVVLQRSTKRNILDKIISILIKINERIKAN